MKKFIALISTFLFLLVCGGIGTAGAVTIPFDDLSGNVAVTNQYSASGITFAQTQELDAWNGAYAPIKHPGDHIAYSGSYGSSIFTFNNTLFSFDLLTTASNTNLYLEAYDAGDTLVTSYSQYIPIGSWIPMSIDLTGVSATKIILHDSGGVFAFDDIDFAFVGSQPGPQPGPEIVPQRVPEPATMLLFGFGLIGMAGFRRKFRKR